MMSRQTGTPTWVTQQSPTHLERIDLSERLVDESWLQEKLDRHPDLIPLEEIGRSWGPLISLGRELPLRGKFIDNMYVSPTGDLTIVEAKLWRNPEARRKVIAQILDYAADLARLDYTSFNDIVSRASGAGATANIWQRVMSSQHAYSACGEQEFVDAVSRNLRTGRFLLLIVGDGIQEGLEAISELLRQHPGIQFHLELIEMKLFRMPEGRGTDDVLIVPSIVGRTREVVHAIVRIERSDDGEMSVEVLPMSEPDPAPTVELDSVDEFLAMVEDSVNAPAAGAVAELVDWWNSLGGQIRLRSKSINFAMRTAPGSSKQSSVLTLYHHGRIEGSVRPLTGTGPRLDGEQTRHKFEQSGFTGSHGWPTRTGVDLSDPVTMAQVKEVMRWCYSKAHELA